MSVGHVEFGPICDVMIVTSPLLETQISFAVSRNVRGMFFAMIMESFNIVFFQKCLDNGFVGFSCGRVQISDVGYSRRKSIVS